MKRGIKWSPSEWQTEANKVRSGVGMSVAELDKIEERVKEGYRWKADFDVLITEIRRLTGDKSTTR